MIKQQRNRLVIFSGPSCVGKSPLIKAFARLYPEKYKDLKPLVLYNSRSARPGEIDGVDYYFRTRHEIEALKDSDDYVVMDVRGDLQAIDLKELVSTLEKSGVLFEGNPFIGRILQTHPALNDLDRLSVFMAPVTRDEIIYLKNIEPAVSLPDIITDIMRRKLLRRTRRQKGELSLNDLENIERRAKSAFRELQDASNFQYVIPSHDGEDSENWDAFYYPLGDARRSLLTFLSLLEEGKSANAEQWEPELLPVT
jgi:guanylate kinase